MTKYTFIYFDVRGRGELCRYVFHAANRDFENKIVNSEEWAEMKPKLTTGQLPVLEVDGKQLVQSGAIARFLAREFDLCGKTSLEQAMCDQYVGLADDFFNELVKSFFEKDEAKLAEVTKKLQDEIIPKFCAIFEKSLEQNGGKFFVGDKLTLADLAVYQAMDTPIKKNPKVLDSYPKLTAQRAMIEGAPGIGEYIKNRKPTTV